MYSAFCFQKQKKMIDIGIRQRPTSGYALGLLTILGYRLISRGTIKGQKIKPQGSGFSSWRLPIDQFREKQTKGKPPAPGARKEILYDDRMDCFGELAYAILRRAIEDIKENEHPLDALVFLYGYGAELAEMLGIDREAWDAQVKVISKQDRAFVESVSLIPPDLVAQPLFYYDELCDLCGRQPHNNWYAQFVHWRAHHQPELEEYLKDLFLWIGKDQWRIQLLGIRTGLELEDLQNWMVRARLFVDRREGR